jgi:hypothetical protein
MELCAEEQELVLERMAGAGHAASLRALKSGLLGHVDIETLCLQILQSEIVGSSATAEISERDPRAAAFCVGFDDACRELCGLPPLPRQVPSLLQAIQETDRQYRSAVQFPALGLAAMARRQLAARLALLSMRLCLIQSGMSVDAPPIAGNELC